MIHMLIRTWQKTNDKDLGHDLDQIQIQIF